MKIKDKKGSKHLVVDHHSRLELEVNEASQVHINDSFPKDQLLVVSHADWTLWFIDILNYLAVRIIPSDLTSQQKKRFFVELRHYLWEDPILYRHCV